MFLTRCVAGLGAMSLEGAQEAVESWRRERAALAIQGIRFVLATVGSRKHLNDQTPDYSRRYTSCLSMLGAECDALLAFRTLDSNAAMPWRRIAFAAEVCIRMPHDLAPEVAASCESEDGRDRLAI